MAGTRTAPAFTAAATARQITLQLIDASGDEYSVNKHVAVASTAAAIEAWAAAYADGTQASLFRIDDNQIRAGAKAAVNADAGDRSGVEQGINLSYSNGATLDGFTTRLIAPVAETMTGDTDIPIVTSDEIVAINVAEIALSAGYTFQSAQYTTRRARKGNPKVKVT